MRVLVLGGTGAMGVHLVRLLSENGYDTFVTSRSNYVSIGNIKYIKGNARDLNFLNPLLDRKWDAIVDFLLYSTDEFRERVDFFLKATSQYIYISSGRVYADTDGYICEDTPRLLDTSVDYDFLATDEYSLAKARQEDILRSKRSKNWTIVRPYITYSIDRFQLGVLEKEEWLYRAIKGRTIIFPVDFLNKQTTLTYGHDVANSLLKLVANPLAIGEIIQITSEEFCVWSDILSLYLDVLEDYLGYRPSVMFQDVDGFVRWRSGNYQVYYDRMFHRRFRSRNLFNFIDVNSFENVRIMLRECLAVFLQHQNFKTIDWKKEALKDRLTNERTPLKEIFSIKEKVKYLVYRYLA